MRIRVLVVTLHFIKERCFLPVFNSQTPAGYTIEEVSYHNTKSVNVWYPGFITFLLLPGKTLSDASYFSDLWG